MRFRVVLCPCTLNRISRHVIRTSVDWFTQIDLATIINQRLWSDVRGLQDASAGLSAAVRPSKVRSAKRSACM